MSEKIGFGLRGITTEQFAILEDNFSKDGDTQFGINIGFGMDTERHSIAPFLKCSFSQNNKRFLILEVACHFEIKEENWNAYYNPEKQSLLIPANFARHLAMITVGTTRGVLHAKTEKTEFSKFIIPTINLEEIITEDVEIEKENG